MAKQSEENKREARKQKQNERMRRHIVICPHCGKEVLDHMTECPHCKGELTPAGYRPPDEKTLRKVKRVCLIVGVIVAVGIVLAILLSK
ncbi:MAG: zinc-ribbon domain-containing protein [Clostridia bacterium]|jgi:predicted amidophosphoribosyltransferase|nr:zinc-ribbon domain-containing protein [Clostridia bacterium]